MAGKDMTRQEGRLPVRRGEGPLFSLWSQIDRLFDDFAHGFSMRPFRALEEKLGVFAPSIDVSEDEKTVFVKAELPGMDEKDIDVSITRDVLTISGEKKEEQEEKKKNYYRMERSFGSFRRVVALPEGIDSEKAQAEFGKGVLTVTIPKTKEAQAAGKKIPIKAEK